MLRYAHRLNSQALKAWKSYTYSCRDRKRRLMNIFHLRATALTRIAFCEGWLVFHRQFKLKKSLNKLTSYFLAKRLLKTALKQLWAYT
jgi:hypothetical protein